MKSLFMVILFTMGFGAIAQDFGYKSQNKKFRDEPQNITLKFEESNQGEKEINENSIVPKYKKRKANLQFKQEFKPAENYKKPYSNRRDKSRGDSLMNNPNAILRNPKLPLQILNSLSYLDVIHPLKIHLASIQHLN